MLEQTHPLDKLLTVTCTSAAALLRLQTAHWGACVVVIICRCPLCTQAIDVCVQWGMIFLGWQSIFGALQG